MRITLDCTGGYCLPQCSYTGVANSFLLKSIFANVFCKSFEKNDVNYWD